MADDLLSSFTEQPLVAFAIVVGVVVIALAKFTNAWDSLRQFLQSDSSTEHWFFGWIVDSVTRRIGTLILLQLVFGFCIYPVTLYGSLTSMTIPGSGLYGGGYLAVISLKWIVATLSILIAVGSWRVQYKQGVLQGTVVPIVAWLILRNGTQFLLKFAPLLLIVFLPLTTLLSLFVFFWFGIKAYRFWPKADDTKKT